MARRHKVGVDRQVQCKRKDDSLHFRYIYNIVPEAANEILDLSFSLIEVPDKIGVYSDKLSQYSSSINFCLKAKFIYSNGNQLTATITAFKL